MSFVANAVPAFVVLFFIFKIIGLFIFGVMQDDFYLMEMAKSVFLINFSGQF